MQVPLTTRARRKDTMATSTQLAQPEALGALQLDLQLVSAVPTSPATVRVNPTAQRISDRYHPKAGR